MVKSSVKNDCIFCKIAKGDTDQKMIFQSNSFFAINDIRPTVKGHMLVIPKNHFVTILDIPDKLGNELLSFTKKVANSLLDEKFGDGFNIVMNNLAVAGQVVMHAHLHLIPRNNEDGIRCLVKTK